MGEVMWCKKCNISSGGKYCRYCGKETVPAYRECPYCKARILTMGKFCEQCGRPVQNGTGQTSPKGEEGVV